MHCCIYYQSHHFIVAFTITSKGKRQYNVATSTTKPWYCQSRFSQCAPIKQSKVQSKFSPCLLVRLGLNRMGDEAKYIMDERAKKLKSRSSPCILVRLGLDKVKEEVKHGRHKGAKIAKPDKIEIDKRIPLYGSSSYIKQCPSPWHLPVSERSPPQRVFRGRLPPSGLLVARCARSTSIHN